MTLLGWQELSASKISFFPLMWAHEILWSPDDILAPQQAPEEMHLLSLGYASTFPHLQKHW
jgi:hypothetical protein